jgi:predicted dehydrogenase
MERNNTKDIKVIFFGFGSIGKKHASIIKKNYDFEIYAYRTGKGQEKNDLKIQEINSIDEVFNINPDIAFITNPTSQHIDTALDCAKRNINLFIEKPISNSLEKIDVLDKEIRKRKLFSYVAYNLRFHSIISKLFELVKEKEKPIYFRAICSSYLPNWRQNQDYSKSYSAKKKFGGGVILDLSHEFDYISWLFGEIEDINGVYGKISDLKINSEDILNAQIKCKSGVIGNLHLDYFSLINERKIQIYYNDSYIEGNLITNNIRIFKDKKEKIFKFKFDMDTTYKKQMDYFFKNYQIKNYKIMNNFSESLKTFKKIMEFKKKNAIQLK